MYGIKKKTFQESLVVSCIKCHKRSNISTDDLRAEYDDLPEEQQIFSYTCVYCNSTNHIGACFIPKDLMLKLKK